MADQNDSANTVLIVIILLILVGFGVWWFTMRGGVVTTPVQESPGINIDVKLPTTTSGTSESTTTGTSTTAQ